MSSIPEEMYLEILLRLPLKSYIVCKQVCKKWYDLISNPNFVKLHLDVNYQRSNNTSLILNVLDRNKYRAVLYSIDHDSLQSLLSEDEDEFLNYATELDYPLKSSSSEVWLIGCSAGLVCLCLKSKPNDYTAWPFLEESFCLWNPVTKEYKELPKSPDVHGRMYGSCMSVFDYDSKRGDHNLINCYRSFVQIYSLQSDSWKIIDINVPYFPCYARTLGYCRGEGGVLFKGNLHWLVEMQDNDQIVISLDTSNGKIKEILLPEKFSDQENRVLVVFEGCLCVLNYTNKLIEVWVMLDYGVRESWTKRHVVYNMGRYYHGIMKHVCSSKNGEMLIAEGNYSNELVLYDSKFRIVRRTDNLIESLWSWRRGDNYLESLVSLNSGTYVPEKKDNRQFSRHLKRYVISQIKR